MMRFSAALGAMLAAVPVSASGARDLQTMSPGAKVERVAEIGDKQVPLPAGEWELVYFDIDRAGSVASGNAFLVRKSDRGIAGYLVVRTNLEGEKGYGWKRPQWCDRRDVHHNGSDRHYNQNDADCWIVNHRVHANAVSRLVFINEIRA